MATQGFAYQAPIDPPTDYQFDYTNQAWVVDGRYVRCGHTTCKIDTGPIFMAPEEKHQYCFGTQHAGEAPHPSADLH